MVRVQCKRCGEQVSMSGQIKLKTIRCSCGGRFERTPTISAPLRQPVGSLPTGDHGSVGNFITAPARMSDDV